MSFSVETALKKARGHIKRNNIAAAEAVYKDILIKFPANQRAISGYKQLQDKFAGNGSFETAPPRQKLEELLGLFNENKFDQVIALSEQLLRLFPKSFDLWNILGVSFAQSNNPENAKSALSKAVEIEPRSAQAYGNLGNVLAELKEFEKAISTFNQALSIEPNNAETLNNLGNALLEIKEFERAIDCLSQAIQINPNYAQAAYNLGKAFKALLKYEEAIDAFNRAISINPKFAEAYNDLGNVYDKLNDFHQAIRNYEFATKCRMDFFEANVNLASVLQKFGRSEEALNYFENAMRLDSNDTRLMLNFGALLQDLGRFEDARQAYENVLNVRPYSGDACRRLVKLDKTRKGDTLFSHLLKMYQSTMLDKHDKCHVCFALASVYENAEDYAMSTQFLMEGNVIRRSILKYDPADDQLIFTRIKNSSSQLRTTKSILIKNKSDLIPIFIIGMPRSGTSLVEQIISAHSSIYGGGELPYIAKFGSGLAMGSTECNEEQIQEFREKYFEELRNIAPDYQYVTDKMPHNFRFVSLINNAFPEAKIVHVKRSPAATCWSNFKQYFSDEGLGYSCDLKDTAEYYQAYVDLMNFWRDKQDIRMLEVAYEKLTEQPKLETKNIFQFLELDLERSCLNPQSNLRAVQTASYQQVREKIYTGSSDNWRIFEPYLGGAFDSLDFDT